jgi:3-oxoacyl-[acyl-carrier-protein] synthase II
MTAQRVAITGIGLVTSLGSGAARNWRDMLDGRSGIGAIDRFPVAGFKTTIAGCVDFLGLPCDATQDERAIAMGDIAVDEALAQARLGELARFPGDFYIAQSSHDIAWQQYLQLAHVAGARSYDSLCAALEQSRHTRLGPSCQRVQRHYAERHDLRRLPVSPITACASGASAIQLAVEAIRAGECHSAMALGTDGIVRPEIVARFSLLSALSTANADPQRASKPFSVDRDGFVFGEAAGALVLEDEAHAKRRGAEILAFVVGCGEAGDNFHRTRSNPTAEPIATCMQRALQDAALSPAQIDYINAHGTSTPENDKMEYLGIAKLFGTGRMPPVSSVKSMIGHTIHAAGAVEAICTILSVATQCAPPTINYQHPDPEIPLDVVPNQARAISMRFALSNSFGFGGQNVCLAIGRA